MALSFEESKRMVAASPAMTLEASIEDARPVVDCDEDVATFSVEDQNFTRSGNYTWFDTFSDNDFSTVDTNKEITLSPTQVNITQENNSQVIPFEMPRYYDGVDLMSMTIQIHYVNANNAENYTAPINVSYSTDKIRFYWMVSNYATIKEGVLKFEIMATGAITVPSSGESKNYLWRTKPNEKLNVLKALTGTAMNNPTDDDWYTQFLSTMSQKVGEAQTAATQAAQSAQEAQAVVNGLADTLANYYTKEEVDGFVTLLRDDIAKVDGLAKFDVQYDAETQTIKFLNGEKVIKTITLNTDPSADWVTAFNKTVEAKIDEKIAPVKTELTEYKTSNDAAVKNLQDSVGNLPETLQSDYYNKQATNKLLEAKAEKTSVETVANDLTVVKNTASGLQNSIDTINGDISEIQEQLKNVKPDPNSGREYDITYEDSKLSLLENGTVKTQVVIQGGGGGGTGGSTSVIKIERLDGSALTVIAGDSAIINFKFSSVDNSGDDTGSATGVWYVGNTKVGTQTVIQGKNSFDATQYLHSGDNTVKLQVTDSVGSVGTKTWTVNVVEFYLESSFDDTLVYSGEVTFRYTPYGNIAKTINFTIDGKILGSTTSSVTGRQLTYAIPAQTHGAHLVEVSMTAEINGKQVTSNKVVKDIMWVTEGNTKDEVSIKLGNDFSYEDITEKVLISKPQVFDGKNYIDTDLKLFEEDRDFVLAVDYKMDVTNANNTVLMQCFEQNGMNGIRLWNSTGVKMTWGIDSANGVAAGSRDMTVIRHIKGDNGLYVYSSNIYGSALNYTKITRTRSTKTNATLVFGCAKADDGAYERHAKGTVYWSKLWYADLGDAACRELAAWTHDDLIVEVASFKNYYLSDNSNKRCSMTFLQKDTLGQDMVLSSAANNAGGWGSTSLREYLDSRLVDALPIGWKQLIKKVKVPSSAGNKSKEIVTSDCYFFIPSAIEVSSSMIDEPYVYEGQTIGYMTGNESRIKHNAEGRATKYWLRSPFATYDGYFYAIEETGELYGFHYPSEQLGVTVMFSI